MSNLSTEGQLELCPMDKRRMPTEMYVKLFVVYFTTIGAYAHLLHIRREPRGIRSYLLMIAAPITGTAFIILPMLGLAIQALWFRGDYETLKLSAGILIGQLPRDGYRPIGASNGALRSETQQDSSLRETPNAEGQLDNFLDEAPRTEAQDDSHYEESSRLSLTILGRILFHLEVLSQRITSLYLFARRAQRGSDALYDHRILQLALLGLSVSAMSVIQLILKPRYPYPDRGQEHATRLRWLSFLRPLLAKELREPDESLWSSNSDPNQKEIVLRPHHGADEVKNVAEGPLLVLDWVYMIIASLLYLAFCPEFSGMPTVHEDTYTFLWHYYIYIIFSFILVGYATSQKHLFWASVAAVISINVFLVFSIAAWSRWEWLWVLNTSPSAPTRHAAYLVTLMTKDNNTASYGNWTYCNQTTYGPDWSHIATYGVAPTFCPCPKAWSDPAANSVWWLA